ncbi:unnamed protein product [Moneuplotes crassus]|uniref:Uncharacterized protein n=1 Tax=Euplotes crassus TaxID=5936 RepID=A0AAD1Y5W2_EUPCR|nr:unnamed protein product [Moneuplotes crassus]
MGSTLSCLEQAPDREDRRLEATSREEDKSSEINTQEKIPDQFPMLDCTKSSIARYTKLLDLYTRDSSLVFKARAWQINNELVSLQEQLENAKSEGISLIDTNENVSLSEISKNKLSLSYKEQSSNLKKQIEELCKQIQSLLHGVEHHKAHTQNEARISRLIKSPLIDGGHCVHHEEARVDREQKILEESDQIDYKICYNAWHNIVPNGGKQFSHRLFTLDLDIYEERLWLKSLKTMTLPYIPKLEIINGSSQHSRLMKHFLRNCFSRKVDRLYCEYAGTFSGPKEDFFEEILNVGHKITKSLSLTSCIVSQTSMVKILSVLRNLQQIEFNCAKICIDDIPQFGHSLDGSSLKILKFKGTFSSGHVYQSFRLLIDGLSECQDFKRNLISIEVARSSIGPFPVGTNYEPALKQQMLKNGFNIV